jgi:hypothetical protein
MPITLDANRARPGREDGVLFVAATRSVTLSALGAWVIKCNPHKTPIEPMRAAGQVESSWCVADNYRSRLIRPEHRVLFWVSAHPQRGLWGAGRVIGNVAGGDGQLRVPVHIRLFTEPVTAAQLFSLPELRSMEAFRSPQQSNPSWVSRAELALIDPLLPST